MCLNVNGGLHDKLKLSDFVKRMREKDVVLLSECWSNKYKDLDIEGFKRISKTRERKKKSKRDSGGLEVYIKNQIAGGVKEVIWDNEDGMCLQLNKDFFGWNRDLTLFFVYFTPINSSRNDVNEGENCFSRLLNKLASVDENSMKIVCGDFNSRVGTRDECIVINDNVEQTAFFPDVDCNEEWLFTENDFLDNNLNIKRSNSDKTVNEYGLKLLDLCQTCDLAIMNGRAGSDKINGSTTFNGSQGESTIDFVLADNKIVHIFNDFSISEPLLFSDHKAVNFGLKCKESDRAVEKEQIIHCTKWPQNNVENYHEHIYSEEVILTFE